MVLFENLQLSPSRLNTQTLEKCQMLLQDMIEGGQPNRSILTTVAVTLSKCLQPVTIRNIFVSKNPSDKCTIVPTKSHLESLKNKYSFKTLKSESKDDFPNHMFLSGVECYGECEIYLGKDVVFDVGLNGEELLAVILHEIGHISSDIAGNVGLYEKFLLRLADISKTFSDQGIRVFAHFIVSERILSRIRTSRRDRFTLDMEVEADSFATKCGYGEHLVSALHKFNRVKFKENDEKYSKQNMGIDEFINDLRTRTGKIRSDLVAQLKSERTDSVKTLIQKQIDNVDKLASEIVVKESYEPVSESVRSLIEMRKKGYSWLEVDEIEVEIDRVETTEDKIYLVHRIHSAIHSANRAKKNAKSSSEYKNLDKFIEDLKKLIPKIKGVKTELSNFTLKIDYGE